MIIIPVSRRPDWRKPPVVTLLLIAINVLIFFGLQSSDDDKTHKAYEYYEKSSLIETELPRYVKHLEASRETKKAALATEALSKKRWFVVLRMMEGDSKFMQNLRDGKIIREGDVGYSLWRHQRNEFDRMRKNTMIERFAFKSAQPTFAGLIGHMFLHGDFGHLLGNMAFLFIVGYMVEEALGKGRYLLFYLLAGIGGCCDALIGTPTMIPSIGASGAISGVMAMYVCLYGMQKIRFFYWVLIYFDFVRAPAITILPFWIAMELFQYLTNTSSNINYLAHLGGFVTGAALIGMVYLFDKKRLPMAPQQESLAGQRDKELQKVEKLLNALRLDEARRELRRLADFHKDDLAIINRYYQIARHAPANDDYHHAAALIFALPNNHPAIDELIYETFAEYLELAKPKVRFSVQQLITLIRSFVRTGHTVDAERLLRTLANRSPDQKELPGLMLLVAEEFRSAGNAAMYDVMLNRLRQNYPNFEHG